MRAKLGVSQRVRDVPLTARVRGIWFSMTSDFIQKLGRGETAMFRSIVPARRRVPFLTYSLREYLEELALAGAVVDARDPAEGIRRIWQDCVPMYLATPLGRSVARLLDIDLVRYLRWCVDHRDHFCNYGQWSLQEHESGHVTIEMENEYVWIESAHRGGAESVLRAFGLKGTVEPERLDDYTGRLHIRWQPQS
jgi:hypothetical protein